MKFIAFLMATLVLICSCIPCRDGIFAAGKNPTEAKILKSVPQQDENGFDNCSPFCSCNCCSGFTFLFTIYKVSDSPKMAFERNIYHLLSKITDASLPVWQPPQLA